MWIANSKADYGWLSGSGVAGPGTYVESNSDPNVAALWKFNESSGNITDSVSSIVLTASGTPQYSVASTGLFSGISPGITFSNDDSFTKATTTAQLTLAANVSFVWEVYFAHTGVGAGVIISTNAVGGTEPGWYLLTSGGNSFTVLLNADDGTNWNAAFAGAAFNDGNYHKVRVKGDRSGATPVEVFVDGISYGTASPTTNGKLITASQCFIGDYSAAPGIGNRYVGTLSTVRITVGNSTNNLGGPGNG